MADTHLIYGMHAVAAALQHEPDSIKTVWMEHARSDKRAQQIVALLKQHAIPLQRVERDELDRMAAGGKHQGVIAEARLQPALDESGLKTLLNGLKVPPFLLILDGVQDPHNLGACLRTADAAGIHAVIAPRDKACGLTSTVRKVASGAAETVPFVQVTNLARTMKSLQQDGIWIIGTDLATSSSLFDTDLSGPLALVLGAEERGLRRLTREACDALVKLPMHGSVQSLNVSVSAGICLYEAVRQREGQGND